jgi:hypothetical protein
MNSQLIAHSLARKQKADSRAYIIRPDNNGQNTFPESQVQKADGEKPTREPGKGRPAAISYFDFIAHMFILKFIA